MITVREAGLQKDQPDRNEEGHHQDAAMQTNTSPCRICPPLMTDAARIAAYRRRYAEVYLPYGVTSVRDVGSAERDLPMLLAWMKRSPLAPDFYPVGAQFVSPEEGRTPPPFQHAVSDSAAAGEQV